MINELIVGHRDENPYDRPAYEVEAGAKTWVCSEKMLKKLEYKEQG